MIVEYQSLCELFFTVFDFTFVQYLAIIYGELSSSLSIY